MLTSYIIISDFQFGNREAACYCKDLEDIINVINGRPKLLVEITNSPKDIVQFISGYFKKLIEDPKWLEAIKAIARLERSRLFPIFGGIKL